MKLKQFSLLVILTLSFTSYAESATTLKVDAKMNCLNVATGSYLVGGSPVILSNLTSGKYVVELKSSNADYGGGNLPVKEAMIWYGSNIPNSTTWYQSIRTGQPVVIDHNPEYALYAFIPDIYCENNTGASVLSIRKVAP